MNELTPREMDIAHEIGHDVPGYISGDLPITHTLAQHAVRSRMLSMVRRIAALEAQVAELQSELSLVKCGEPNHPDRAYAMKGWLKTFGFKVFATLKHDEVGYVLSLLQAGDISRGKAAEAIAELLVGNEPPLPQLVDDMCGEDDLPREIVNSLRSQVAELTAALNSAYARCPQLVTDASNSGDNRPRAALDAARKATTT